MTLTTLNLTLNDSQPDPHRPSRWCRSFDTVFMSLFRYVDLSISRSFEPLPLKYQKLPPKTRDAYVLRSLLTSAISLKTSGDTVGVVPSLIWIDVFCARFIRLKYTYLNWVSVELNTLPDNCLRDMWYVKTKHITRQLFTWHVIRENKMQIELITGTQFDLPIDTVLYLSIYKALLSAWAYQKCFYCV